MKEKILVVDDEKEIADLIEVYLQNENMEVYKFYRGRTPLPVLREWILIWPYWISCYQMSAGFPYASSYEIRNTHIR